jgi:hypothetical protein
MKFPSSDGVGDPKSVIFKKNEEKIRFWEEIGGYFGLKRKIIT